MVSIRFSGDDFKLKPRCPELNIYECSQVHLEEWNGCRLSSPIWRLYLNDNAQGAVVFKGEKTPIKPQQIFMIAPETDCISFSSGSLRHFYIHFDAGAPYSMIRNRIWQYEPSPLFLSIVERIRNDKNPAAMAALCQLALSQIPNEDIPSHKTDPRILRIIKRIDQNCSKKYNNSDFAEMAGISTNAFIRLFRKDTGMPPQQYITEARLKKSCIMLQYSERSIDEIAEECGFCDRFYFSRIFRIKRNMSPAEYRKQSV